MQSRWLALSATIRYNRIANWKRTKICSHLELPWKKDGQTRTNDPLDADGRRTMCITLSVGTASLSHVTTLWDQQNIVVVIYHTLVERGE